ncbi:unnamed protein product [Toxocara canis]|uniref:Uncharacterized protein n=1 Tax=Toxocara canis TaxID=6265 RepID=A0A183UQ76_TOXCA|nr:unnamed protein product [Toxocara canis]
MLYSALEPHEKRASEMSDDVLVRSQEQSETATIEQCQCRLYHPDTSHGQSASTLLQADRIQHEEIVVSVTDMPE